MFFPQGVTSHPEGNMKLLKSLVAAIASVEDAFFWIFKRFFPYGCGHFGLGYSFVNFRFTGDRVRIVSLTKRECQSRLRCRKCLIAYLAKVSIACPYCRWPIIPNDPVYHQVISVSADFSVDRRGRFLICASCRSEEQFAGHWSEQGLVRADQHEAASG